MPDWVPAPRLTVIVTGLCELAGVLGLAGARPGAGPGSGSPSTRSLRLPANLKHALNGIVVPACPKTWWYHGPSLALAFQPVFVWWALYAGGVIDWPFRSFSETLTFAQAASIASRSLSERSRPPAVSAAAMASKRRLKLHIPLF